MHKAGRHGSYATQFWTRPNHPPYRSRREMLTAHSKKAIQRRLVLPLDEHDWGRALEVLGAGYARLGRTAEDYQRVIRGIANETAPQRRSCAVQTLNALRDKAYAGEITSSGLWVTFVWAYARLRLPQEGYESLLQAERRFRFSPLTKQHMGEILLPLLVEFGMLSEVKYVVENFMSAGGSRQDKERLAGFVAEAAARNGSWENAMRSLSQESTTTANGSVIPNSRTLAGLFVSEEVNAGGDTLNTSQHLQRLSTKALRCMMCSMADDGQWFMALRCLQALQRDSGKDHSSHTTFNNGNHSSGDVVESSVEVGQQTLSLSEDELQRLLNSLGSHQRWEEATALFASQYFTGTHSPGDGQVRRLHATTLNLLFASFPREKKEYHFVALDKRQLSCVSSTAQKEESKEDQEVMTLQLDTMHHPQQVVALVDRVLNERDDVVVTDWMMAAVGPSLVQLGQWDRALHLLRQAPALSAVKPPVCAPEAHRQVRKQLVTLLYFLYAAFSLECRCYTLYHFPFVFPKEAFSGMPPPSELAAHLKSKRADVKVNSPASSPLVPEVSGTRRFASRRRPAIVQHTERHDDELRRRLSSLYANRSNAFRGGDVDKDPRPLPKGLHNTANGWNFYGRGGEMVFMNHRRTAHPFSLHPKVMRSLADPYRGWSLAQNSCWGHRERVKKWNGNSAV